MHPEVTVEPVSFMSALLDFVQQHRGLVAIGVLVALLVMWAALRADAREEARRR
jgi:hypothetical protein